MYDFEKEKEKTNYNLEEINNHSFTNSEKSNKSKNSNKTHSTKKSGGSMSIISKEYVNSSLTNSFPILYNLQNSHCYFCSYEFHKNEEYMVEFWKSVIKAIYDIKSTSCIKYSELLDYSTINDRFPMGFSNIILELVNRETLITSNLIEGEENKNYYYKFHSSLYPKSYTAYLSSYIPFFGLNSTKLIENLNTEDTSLAIIFKDAFLSNANSVLEVIDDLCKKIEMRVFSLSQLKSEINHKFKLDDFSLNYILKYLEKTKTIIKFLIKINNIDTICYKRVNKVNEKLEDIDFTFINIQNVIFNLDKKIDELEIKTNELQIRIKDYLKQNNRTVSF